MKFYINLRLIEQTTKRFPFMKYIINCLDYSEEEEILIII